MLRTVCVRPTLWEAMLPPEDLLMPTDFEAVDTSPITSASTKASIGAISLGLRTTVQPAAMA